MTTTRADTLYDDVITAERELNTLVAESNRRRMTAPTNERNNHHERS
jgi:hypothetical protein